MRSLNGTFSLLRHTVAGLTATTVLTAIPILLYLVLAVMSDDPGGPMMVVIVPMLSLAFAAGLTLLAYFPYACFCQWLARRRSIARWLPVLLFALLSFLFFGALGALTREYPSLLGYLGFTAAFGGLATLGFVVYWVVLVFTKRGAGAGALNNTAA